MQAARNLGICKEDIHCALIMAKYDVECDAVDIEQSWNAEVVEESFATTTQVQVALPILVRAPTNCITAMDEVEHDAVETATETWEGEVKSFAGTSTENSYPIRTRACQNSPTPENDFEPDDAAEVAETGKDEAKSLARASSQDSHPTMAPPPNSTTSGNGVPHDTPVENVQAEKDKTKTFAGTSEGPYPIMARALTSVQRRDAGEGFDKAGGNPRNASWPLRLPLGNSRMCTDYKSNPTV